MCAKLEEEVDSRLTIRAEKLWSFRWKTLLARLLYPVFHT